MTQGAVVADRDGNVVLRNAFAKSFVDARHGDALVEAAIRELIAHALRGGVTDREVELFGPPKRTILVHASPLMNDDDRWERAFAFGRVSNRLDGFAVAFEGDIFGGGGEACMCQETKNSKQKEPLHSLTSW